MYIGAVQHEYFTFDTFCSNSINTSILVQHFFQQYIWDKNTAAAE